MADSLGLGYGANVHYLMYIHLVVRKTGIMNIIFAPIAKLNQYSDPHFLAVMAQITAAQEEGLSSFELDVKLLDDDEIKDLVIALEFMGYLTQFDQDAFNIEVMYE